MKKYNVLGIGNAVVDVISQSSDSFLNKMNIEKGIMQLVDRERGELLYNSMGNRNQAPGGSVANTIAGVGALGLKTGFVGKERVKFRRHRWIAADLDGAGTENLRKMKNQVSQSTYKNDKTYCNTSV